MEKKTKDQIRKELLRQDSNNDFEGFPDRLEPVDADVVIQKRENNEQQ